MGNIPVADTAQTIEKVCVECNHTFFTKDKIVTDKGTMGPSDRCPTCQRAMTERFIAGLRN